MSNSSKFVDNNSNSARNLGPYHPSHNPSQSRSRIREASDDEFDNLSSLEAGRGRREKKPSRKVSEAQEHGEFHPMILKSNLTYRISRRTQAPSTEAEAC